MHALEPHEMRRNEMIAKEIQLNSYSHFLLHAHATSHLRLASRRLYTSSCNCDTDSEPARSVVPCLHQRSIPPSLPHPCKFPRRRGPLQLKRCGVGCKGETFDAHQNSGNAFELIGGQSGTGDASELCQNATAFHAWDCGSICPSRPNRSL